MLAGWASSLLVLAAGRLPAQTAPAAAGETKPLRLVAALLDGSTLSGTPSTNLLPIDTSFARIPLDMRQIQSVEFKESGEATVVLKGGDRVSGKVGCADLTLATAAGSTKLPLTSLQSLDMLGGIVPADLRKGLVAHLPFNEESSFGANAGEWEGEAVATATRWIADGFFGGACRFDPGKHAVRLAHGPEFAGSAFTLVMWLRGGKPDASGGRSSPEQVIVSKRGQGRNSGFWVSQRQRNIIFCVGGAQQNHNTIAAPYPTSDDWWMLAATYDGRTMRLIGSSGVLSSTDWPGYAPVEADLLLGASGLEDDGRSNWNGDMDEFMFFNRALSVEEVAQLSASASKRRPFARAEATIPTGSVRVIAELNEGSKVKGEVESLTFFIHNVFAGALEVPIGAVRGIRFAPGTNEVVMALVAGDLIKGTVTLAPLKVKALFGGITLPAFALSTLSVGEKPADLPAIRSAGGVAGSPADLRLVRALIEQLRRSGQKERETAVVELAQIGESAILPLREALKDAESDMKWWIEAAIQQIQDRVWNR